ncbi:MAG: chemotaxis protein CheW, partial [Verrucomicrobiia bacterium]
LHTLPEAPHYIDGLANLRGTFIPVANLRTRLGHAVGEQNERTAIIVVRMPGTGDKGLLVDAVEQVVRIERERLEHPPVGGSGGSCVAGIARLGEQEDFLTVLDIDQICGEFSPTPPPVSAAATPAADAGADMDWFDCGPVAT